MIIRSATLAIRNITVLTMPSILLAMIRTLKMTALLGIVVLAGCATTAGQNSIPAAIQHPPPGNLQLSEAMREPKRHFGASVRWGGSVITVRKQADGNVEIEILERILDDQGRPLDSGPSNGRFLIRADASVDSDLYRTGNRITVAGVFQRLEQRRVGNTEQALALVEVNDFMQWAEPRLDRPYYAWPYYDDPFYRPYYYPYYRWPYYFPRFHLGFGYSN